MSVPPPPNQWGSQPPTGGQPGAPQWGPTGGQPGRAPQWGPQQPWGPPPRRGGKGKWIFGGIALLAVIAVTVVITVLVVGKDSGSSPNPTGMNGNSSDIASANDKGPVAIITDDPTCDAWGRVAREYSAQSDAVKWGDRDQTVPATAWNTEQRSMYEAVSKAASSAADQAVNLVRLTPHRVMRELYEQFIAYSRAFTGRIPTYTANDRYLAGTTDGLSSALAMICSAIDYRSAPTIAPLIPATAPPSKFAQVGDANDPHRFLVGADPVCSDWTSIVDKFSSDTADWRATDPAIPATQWTAEVKAINDKVAPIMIAHADDLERLGRRSDNPTFQDFAVLSAQYQRAFAKVLPTYTTADFYLGEAASFLVASVNSACKAAG
jgi:hypothetical protein